MAKKKEYRSDLDNPAKTLSKYSRTTGKKAGKKSGKHREKQKKSTPLSKQIGYLLVGVQAIASLAFFAMIMVLDMLPGKYLGVVAAVLALFLLLSFIIQFKSKKKGIAGKILCVFMSIVLAFGTYYIGKANGAVKKISGGEYKIDNIVVAVRADDPAEKLADAKDYTFGVQYNMGGDNIRDAVATINKEIGGEITTAEYNSLNEQATALHDGTVNAIIYNEGYTGILEEAFEGYNENVKIIYKHSIKTLLDKKASEVNVTDDTFSVFISGIDVYGPIATNSRSDVNMIATVNTKTHQILLTTTPRDFYVEIPGVSGGMRDKLTHAGIYGVDASIATLSQLYDMDIDFYARVNFTSLVEIVNVLGGIDVYSEYAFETSWDASYDMGELMYVQEGMNTFNGDQALVFCRERQNIPGGDNQRGKNQQAVIKAIIKKMISPAILMQANGIIDSVSGNVETSMTQDQIQELIKGQLNGGGAWNIYTVAAEGTGDSQPCFSSGDMPLSVIQPDQMSVDNIKSLVDRVEQGEILEGSESVQ